MRTSILALTLSLSFAVSACGGDDDGEGLTAAVDAAPEADADPAEACPDGLRQLCVTACGCGDEGCSIAAADGAFTLTSADLAACLTDAALIPGSCSDPAACRDAAELATCVELPTGEVGVRAPAACEP